MYSVSACIWLQHELFTVALAGAVCVAGSWAVVVLFSRMLSNSGAQRGRWLSLAAIAAGSTIWCTHFVAMLAYRPNLPVTFDFALTVVSLLVAAGGAGVGFSVAAWARAGARRRSVGRSWALPWPGCTMPACSPIASTA